MNTFGASKQKHQTTKNYAPLFFDGLNFYCFILGNWKKDNVLIFTKESGCPKESAIKF